ncbi:MFS transporter [Pseudomonas sp. X10]
MTLSLDTQAALPASTPRARARLAAIVLFAAITPSVLMTAPVVAAQLAGQWGLTPTQIGNLFMVELGAMSLATLPAAFWLKRVDLRKAALIAGLMFILGNLLSTRVDGYSQLILLRAVTALGGGSLMIICMSSAAPLPNASRVYALWVLGQLVLGAVGLHVLPGLFAQYGLGACYLTLAGLMMLALPLARAFPAHLDQGTSNPSQRLRTGKALLGLTAIFCFYLSLSGVWTFIGSLGEAASISAQDSGQVLAIATLMGILGAGLASLIGNRLPRNLLLLLGYGLMVTAVLLLQDQPGLQRFALAALTFKFTWTFVLPMVLACMADLDPSGRLMNVSNLVIGGGLAAGPGIAGQLIQSSGDYQSTLLGAATLTFVSLLLALACRIRNPH